MTSFDQKEQKSTVSFNHPYHLLIFFPSSTIGYHGNKAAGNNHYLAVLGLAFVAENMCIYF